MSTMNHETASNTKLLLATLKSHANHGIKPHIVISELYEQLTSNELHRDTDINNGEDFEYKHGVEVCMTSCGLHQEVVDYFGFTCMYLRVDERSLFFNSLTNAQLADSLIKYQLISK